MSTDKEKKEAKVREKIPWTTSGVYVSGVLGVDVLQYAKYSFFCILCPLIAIVYALAGLFIWEKDEEEDAPAPEAA